MSANSKLGEQLISLHRQKFTGVLTIKSVADEIDWEMFFHQGGYLWTEGGFHPNRSWRRNFKRSCPGVDAGTVILREQPEMRSRAYCLLNVLWQRKQITRQQLKTVIESRSQEVLFDLFQTEYNGNLEYVLTKTSSHYLLKAGFSLSLIFPNIEQILFQSQTAWSSWGSKGLASCSPHHAPLLTSYRDLQTQLPDIIYANMTRLLNGKRTLRDLAVRMDKNVLDLTCGIVPYFFKGYLRLLEVSDLSAAQAIK
ncbi:MAG: DUF4388 domain-containing protein [Cyanobacteria bacterium J06623_7]